MIIWITGLSGSGKTTLAKNLIYKLSKKIKKKTIHIDGDNLRELTINKDYSDKGRETNIRNAQMMAEYLHGNGCDVVVSLVSPYRWLREEFKKRIGVGDFCELYIHTTEKRERNKFHTKDYEPPEIEFIDVDTTKDSPDMSFSKIINHLKHLNKL